MPEIKKWNIALYFLIFVAVSFGGKLVVLVTDYYWFQEINFATLFNKTLLTQLSLGSAAGVLGWIVLFLNLSLAKRHSRRPLVIIEPDARISAPPPIPQLTELKPLIHSLMVILTFVAAFFLGSWAGRQWEVLLKFLNGVPFDLNDPLFNRDIGFYVFTLPFYRLLYHFSFIVLMGSAVLASITYFLNTRIYISETQIRVGDDVKAHLSVLAGFFFILLAAYFQFKMFDLLSAQRTVSPGAGYSDIHATLPAMKVLQAVAGICALMFWSAPWIKNSKVLLVPVLAIVLGTILTKIYSEVVQKFQVAPNEIVRETPYLKLAIEYTRRAYGLTDIQELEFDPQEGLNVKSLDHNSSTVENIRLWEHRPLLTSYAQLQEIRTYYDFLDADNDRYFIDGQYRQVMLSARELVPESLPSRIWINEHLVFTHGYGLCMGPVNRISPEGLPEFFIKDIPPVSNTSLQVTQPRIYFGESRAKYAIVNTLSKEFDYPSGDDNVYTVYDGSGGVPVKNIFRKALFAMRFGELKILFSKDLKPESRFLYYRPVMERFSKAAPFLHFDSDPYLVVSDEGKLFWIADAYTATDQYPYSEKTAGINYIRNSVKATLDAYNGTVALYVSSPQDPIIRTYSKIFPDIFKPMEQMPKDLLRHVRYPQTLMNIQAKVYSLYHMTDPQVFYNKEDLWKIPLRTAGGASEQMEPYYTIMKLAGVGEKEEFILMVPFTPAKKENMIAWMAARCDEPNYGKLLVYDFPKQKLVYGPQQIESRIDQDAEISKQLTLWNQGGSRVLRGNLLVIPVEESLLYIQPLYLEASGGGLPELKRVIVAYGNAIAMEENLEISLMAIFGKGLEKKFKGDEPARPSKKDSASLIKAAQEHFDRAQRSSRQGDWSGYGNEIKMLEKVLNELSGSQSR